MSTTTTAAVPFGSAVPANIVSGPGVALRPPRPVVRISTVVTVVWLAALVLSAFAVYMAIDDWETLYRRGATRVLMSVPVSLPSLPSGEAGAWGTELTAGLTTSVDYDRQQLSMAAVRVDPHLKEQTCRDYSWSPGVAEPANSLVCLGEGYWKRNLQTYYLLGHELAHIALTDFGAVHEGFGHGAEHSELTVKIMVRMMERDGLAQWKIAAAERGVALMRSHCHSALLC